MATIKLQTRVTLEQANIIKRETGSESMMDYIRRLIREDMKYRKVADYPNDPQHGGKRDRDRYSYDEIYRRYLREKEQGSPFVHELPEHCPKCGNGAIEHLTENDDCVYAWCTWCHKKWLADDDCDPPGDYASGG